MKINKLFGLFIVVLLLAAPLSVLAQEGGETKTFTTANGMLAITYPADLLVKDIPASDGLVAGAEVRNFAGEIGVEGLQEGQFFIGVIVFPPDFLSNFNVGVNDPLDAQVSAFANAMGNLVEVGEAEIIELESGLEVGYITTNFTTEDGSLIGYTLPSGEPIFVFTHAYSGEYSDELNKMALDVTNSIQFDPSGSMTPSPSDDSDVVVEETAAGSESTDQSPSVSSALTAESVQVTLDQAVLWSQATIVNNEEVSIKEPGANKAWLVVTLTVENSGDEAAHLVLGSKGAVLRDSDQDVRTLKAVGAVVSAEEPWRLAFIDQSIYFADVARGFSGEPSERVFAQANDYYDVLVIGQSVLVQSSQVNSEWMVGPVPSTPPGEPQGIAPLEPGESLQFSLLFEVPQDIEGLTLSLLDGEPVALDDVVLEEVPVPSEGGFASAYTQSVSCQLAFEIGFTCY